MGWFANAINARPRAQWPLIVKIFTRVFCRYTAAGWATVCRRRNPLLTCLLSPGAAARKSSLSQFSFSFCLEFLHLDLINAVCGHFKPPPPPPGYHIPHRFKTRAIKLMSLNKSELRENRLWGRPPIIKPSKPSSFSFYCIFVLINLNYTEKIPYLCDTAGMANKKKTKTKPGKASPAIKEKNNEFLFLFQVCSRSSPDSICLPRECFAHPFLHFLFAQDSPLIHLPGETATKTNCENGGKHTKIEYSLRENN